MYTWGVNDECALGRVTDDDGSTEPRIVKGINLASKGDRVIQLVAGDSHTLALTMLGEVWGWCVSQKCSSSARNMSWNSNPY